jgi:hypothetical protein
VHESERPGQCDHESVYIVFCAKILKITFLYIGKRCVNYSNFGVTIFLVEELFSEKYGHHHRFFSLTALSQTHRCRHSRPGASRTRCFANVSQDKTISRFFFFSSCCLINKTRFILRPKCTKKNYFCTKEKFPVRRRGMVAVCGVPGPEPRLTSAAARQMKRAAQRGVPTKYLEDATKNFYQKKSRKKNFHFFQPTFMTRHDFLWVIRGASSEAHGSDVNWTLVQRF